MLRDGLILLLNYFNVFFFCLEDFYKVFFVMCCDFFEYYVKGYMFGFGSCCDYYFIFELDVKILIFKCLLMNLLVEKIYL